MSRLLDLMTRTSLKEYDRGIEAGLLFPRRSVSREQLIERDGTECFSIADISVSYRVRQTPFWIAFFDIEHRSLN